MQFRGICLTLGNNISTDEIISARYLRDFENLHKHLFENLNINKNYSIIIAKKNFGCGSSREQAVIGLKQRGVKCIIAKSFARIFYRNAINLALPILEGEVIANNGDEIEVDFYNGKIINLNSKKEFFAKKPSEFELKIIEKGGIINYYKNLK